VTPDRLAKIKAMAEDARGDPATRAIAQSILKRYAQEPPKPEFRDVEYKDPRHPGVRTGADYEKWRYMDLSAWRKTGNGNPACLVTGLDGRPYRIVLFRHKKTPTFGWMVVDIDRDETEFSNHKFTSMAEAHKDAWKNLME
jgi:hypothetical protein